MAYSSAIWTPAGVWMPPTAASGSNWGWIQPMVANLGTLSYGYSYSYCYTLYGGQYYSQTGETWMDAGFVYTDSQGTQHPFAGQLSGYEGQCNSPVVNNTLTVTATDGSGLTLTVSDYYGDSAGGTITTPDGTVLQPAITYYQNGGIYTTPSGNTITDRNGNQITSNSSGQYTDTTGNVALTVAQNTSGGNQTVTYTYTAPSGPQYIYFNYSRTRCRPTLAVRGSVSTGRSPTFA